MPETAAGSTGANRNTSAADDRYAVAIGRAGPQRPQRIVDDYDPLAEAEPADRALDKGKVLGPIGAGHAEGAGRQIKRPRSSRVKGGAHRALDLRDRAIGPSIDVATAAAADPGDRPVEAGHQRHGLGISGIHT